MNDLLSDSNIVSYASPCNEIDLYLGNDFGENNLELDGNDFHH